MNIQRIKSFVLLSLVIISFVLTTRIWFNTSIEGLFDMSKNSSLQTDLIYDKENLLKPSKLVVNTGENHILLFNNTMDKDFYSFILNSSKDTIRDWLTNYESYSLSKLSKGELLRIRKERAVELIFEYNIDIENIKSLLGIENNPWKDITEVTSIIISPFENKIYVIDQKKESIYQFSSAQKSPVLTGVIAEIEKRNYFSDTFLNDYNQEDLELYNDFAIAPVSIATMPVLKVKNEIQLGDKLDPQVASFFNEDSSSINRIKGLDGKVTYTDREEETITIDAQGALEYYKYNISPDNTKDTEVMEATEIAAQYVYKHLGYTYDFYLSKIDSISQGGRTIYTISFDYKYNGVPIITDLDTGRSAIEVEVMGKEVRRYKRNVRVIEQQGQTINIMSFTDILDIVWGNLDSRLNTTKSASIVALNDLYLGYLERNATLIPVWVVNVLVEGSDGTQYEKKYLIDAEEGEIGVILVE